MRPKAGGGRAEAPVRIVTTIWNETYPRWSDNTELVDRRTAGMLRQTVRLARRARHGDVVVVMGAIGARERYIDHIGAIAIRWLSRPRPAVVIADATWEVGSQALSQRFPWASSLMPKVARTVVRLLDHPGVIYCVLSTAELQRFPRTWGVDPSRIRFTPFYATIDAEPDDTEPGDYIFAGGDSLRDYRILLDAVDGLDIPVRVATRHRFEGVPANVELGPTSHEEFVRALAGCRISVVPLADSVRSAGQQTYLNAMRAGKLTIVTDVAGVRDYIESGVTGIVTPGTAKGLREAIEWAYDPANAAEVRTIAQKGRAAASGFTFERYYDDLLAVAFEAAGRHKSR